LIIILLFSSCKSFADRRIQSNNQFDTLSSPSDSQILYFKIESNPQGKTPNALDSFTNQWYSVMLFNLKEPVIKNYQGEKEICRFTWLRTFNHPVSIRIEKQNNIIKLFNKICNGAGGYRPGKLILDTTINITKDQYDSLAQKLDNINFWNLKTEQLDDRGNDGSEWIFEAIKNNKYHMVTRWTPSEARQGNFRTVGEYLISLSKMDSSETKDLY
jgi:hypothetical protein